MKIRPRGWIGSPPDESIRANERGTDRDPETRSRSRVKRIAQFQRNVPTRPRSRSIAICQGKDGMRYVTVISGARETKRERVNESERWREKADLMKNERRGSRIESRMIVSDLPRPDASLNVRSSRSGLPGVNGSREINGARYWRTSQKVKPFDGDIERERERVTINVLVLCTYALKHRDSRRYRSMNNPRMVKGSWSAEGIFFTTYVSKIYSDKCKFYKGSVRTSR